MIIDNKVFNASLIVEVECAHLLGDKPYGIEAVMINGAVKLWRFDSQQERNDLYNRICRVIERLENPIMQVGSSSPIYGPKPLRLFDNED